MLAGAQVALVAAGGALPSLHLGTASHHHLFCPDHQRFEDEAWAADPAASGDGRRAIGEGAGTERRHAACALSNLLLRPQLGGAAERAPRLAAGRPLEPKPPPGAGHAPLSALSLAPKHSPPPAPPRSAG